MCKFAYGFITGIPLNILIIYYKDPNFNRYCSYGIQLDVSLKLKTKDRLGVCLLYVTMIVQSLCSPVKTYAIYNHNIGL